MESSARTSNAPDRRRMLAVYLRDHHAGSTAGLSLVRRCRRANDGTMWDDALAPIEAEIAEDRHALESIMSSLGVEPSAFKSAIAATGERLARLKSNGRLIGYTPLSRLIELETLAAGIATKRKLWRSLRHVSEVDAAQIERLIDRASTQLERVLELHSQAANEAFGNRRAAMTEAV
jgi:hypothetical protein